MRETLPLPEDRLWREKDAKTGESSRVEERVAFLWQRANLDPEPYSELLTRVKANGWRWDPRPRNGSWHRALQFGGLLVGSALFVNLALASLFGAWNSSYQFSGEKETSLPVPSVYRGTRELRWRRLPGAKESQVPEVPAGDRPARVRARTSPSPGPALLLKPPMGAAALPFPPIDDALGGEAVEIARALKQLNAEHDPEGALATLVVYSHRFPEGKLLGEATLLAVDANLAAGRKSEALATLDRLLGNELLLTSRPQTNRSSELRLLRAELLAGDERCKEALPAFQELLAIRMAPSLEERALYGAAQCYLRLGNPDLGRGTLTEYLHRFPNGRYAASIRSALSR